jgi:DNA-binding MarR family transcriptional regulator
MSHATENEAEINEFRYLILALQREGNRALAAALKPTGLTPSQAEALIVLADRQPLTLAGLGALLVCESRSSPSRLVDRLVTQGLVARSEDADDRRYVTLSLTPAGQTAVRRARRAEAEFLAALRHLVGDVPLQPLLRGLRGMAASTPGGQALNRRWKPCANSSGSRNS